MSLTQDQLDSLIKDEWNAYKEYTRLGLPNLAKDELKHYNFLKKLKKQRFGG